MTSTDPRLRLRHSMTERPVAGTFIKLPGRAGIDLAHRAGFDFVVVDLEHSTLDDREALAQVAHATALGLPALVRLASVDAAAVNRLLEVGAAGIQLSTLRSTAQAAALRAATRYSPDGTRSISLAHPGAGYGTTPLAEYLRVEAAAPPLVVGQIETATTDSPLGEVVEPLDVAFVGSTDLAVDLGHGADPRHPEVIARIEDIILTTTGAGRIAGSFANQPSDLPGLFAAGVRYVVVGSDLASLGRALSASAADSLAAATAAAGDRP